MYQNVPVQRGHRSSARARRESPDLSRSSAESIDDVHPEEWTPSWDDDRDGPATYSSTESTATPLDGPTTWPPEGLTAQSVLNIDEALLLVAEGAVYFRGVSKPAHHAVDYDAHIFSLLSLNNGQRILEASPSTETLSDCASFPLNASMGSPDPWDTLEQPSMAYCFGRYTGTMTFSRYIGKMNRPAAEILHSSKIMLRRINSSHIFARLRLLQDKADVPFAPTEQEEAFLYGQLLVDPGFDGSNWTLERDIEGLSSLLNNEVWIDFGDPDKQFVAVYYADEASDTSAEFFFHQILLSAELDRRITFDPVYGSRATEYSLVTLPRKVAWSVALSRRFFQNMTFNDLDAINLNAGSWRDLVPRNKLVRLETVLDVGYAMEWPAMDQMEARMIVECEGEPMRCGWSVPSVTFLCGTILPGPAASWMVLSCLLDCNPIHRIILGGLEALNPQSGFQYRTKTYWYWESIVGKVLGAMEGTKLVAGWIGPCIYTTDLDTVEYVRIHQKRAPARMRKRDLRSIAARSDPLGAWDSSYPVANFHLITPNNENKMDMVRVERLVLKTPTRHKDSSPIEHEVAVQFIINGGSYLVRLRYDVSFVAAAVCWAGPHPLCHDYLYKAIRVDEIFLDPKLIGLFGKHNAPRAVSADYLDAQDDDTVLVVEAYGAADNAVLARAW
ncbi:MAG: hypothetical protein Q9170_000818 [Blastenia crenularia]